MEDKAVMDHCVEKKQSPVMLEYWKEGNRQPQGKIRQVINEVMRGP